MAPNSTEAREFRLNKSLSSGPMLGKPNQLWWPNHQAWGFTRDLAKGPDSYFMHDRDGHPSRPCLDKRFRSLSATDTTNFNKFGPTETDFAKNRVPAKEGYLGMVMKSHTSWAAHPARIADQTDPHRTWVLDKSKLYGKDKLEERCPTRLDKFTTQSAPRFHYVKLFGRDYKTAFVRLNDSDAIWEREFLQSKKAGQEKREKEKANQKRRVDVPTSALTSAAAAAAACRTAAAKEARMSA